MANHPAARVVKTSTPVKKISSTVSSLGPGLGKSGLSLLSMADKLVVKVTAGVDAPERCSQAFTVAATALSSGAQVSLWLTGESAWFALPDRAAEFELPDLLAALLAGVQVTLCTQCAARRDIEPDDVLPGIRIAGAATFVEEVLGEGTQAIVY
jgi:predicted peroxiredoxin